jgi:hypothetical protein
MVKPTPVGAFEAGSAGFDSAGTSVTAGNSVGSLTGGMLGEQAPRMKMIIMQNSIFFIENSSKRKSANSVNILLVIINN